MIRLLLKGRYLSIATTLIALGLLLAFGRHVTYEQSIQSFFAQDDPAVVAYRESSRLFGNDNVVFVCYDDPALMTDAGMDRVGELARAIGPGEIGAVLAVESLDAMPMLWKIDEQLVRLGRLPPLLRRGAIAAAKEMVKKVDPKRGALTVGGAIRAADEAGRAAIVARVTAHPLFVGTVVDSTARTTALVVRLRPMGEQEPKETVAALRQRADAFARLHGLKRPALVGPPILLADGYASIEKDGRRLAVAGMALIGLVTLTATRSLWWAILPILAGWVVWLAAETILAVTGQKLSLSGGPLVAQIIVLTMPAASHLAIHFRDDRRREADRARAARSTLQAVSAPIFWTAMTGTIGYGALLSSNVVPVRQFGLILAICTLAAAALTMLISPLAMLPPFRLEIPVRLGSTSMVAGRLNRLTLWVLRHPAPIVLVVLAAVIPLAAGLFRLRYESNYINAFKPTSRVVQDYKTVESRLGGIGVVALIVPVGPTINPATLGRFRDLDRRIRQIASRRRGDEAAVSHVLSLATVLDPDGTLAALPKDQEALALATKLDLIAASPQSSLLAGFWNRGEGRARIVIRIAEAQEASSKEATFAEATDLARAAFGPTSFLTGLSYLLTQTTRGVIATQWTTFFWSIGGILLMLTIAFRGPLLAALALLPTLLAVGLVLGLMGWIGIKLDVATALIASVALGLSVDDTFHCLLQYRRHRRAGDAFAESLLSSYRVTGPGVLLSSFAVAIGFAVLWVSEFVPFSNFGAMVGIATAGSTLGNLILLPACLALGNRLRTRPPVPVAAVTHRAPG